VRYHSVRHHSVTGIYISKSEIAYVTV